MKKSVTRTGSLFLWSGLGVLLLLFALACGAAEEPTPTTAPLATPTPTAVATPTPTPIGGVPKRGGTITQYGSYPSHWDSTQLCCPDGLMGPPKVYLSVLYDADRGARLECDLCQDGKWTLENGGKTLVLKLRGDATFHDGKPITAKDIKYSIEKVMGKIDKIANVRIGFVKTFVESVEAPDDRTVKINMIRPGTIVAEALTVGLAVVFPEGTTRKDMQEAPVGPNNKYTSGPFILKEAVRDSHLLMERNPNYFKKGLPYLDSIRIQVFSDRTAGTTALLIGKVDMYNDLDSPPAQFWPQINKKEKAGELAIVEVPQYCTSGNLFLNHNDPLFKDARVRKAFNLALDRVEYGQVRYSGDYIAATHFPENSPWGLPPEKIWDVVPGWGTGANKKAEREEAKKLLADAGYPTGLDFVLMASGTDPTTGASEVIQRNLRTIGVNVKLDLAADASQRWAKLDYRAHNFRSCLAIGDPDELVANYFIEGGPRNLQAYKNAEIERLFPLMSAETDPAKRKLLVDQIETIALDDQATIVMADGVRRYVRSSKIQGFKPGITVYKVSPNRGEDWWLKQ